MANIKLDLTALPFDGQIVTFSAPCNCNEVTDGLIINGDVYVVCDAMGECVTGKGGAWASGAQISVVLDVTNKKAYIQNQAGGGTGATATRIEEITLPASGWSGLSQTVSCAGILADETKQVITVFPAMASRDEYMDSGITCTGVGANMLTFKADAAPAADLIVHVAIEEAGQAPLEVYSTEETVVGTWIDGKPIYRRTFITTLITGTKILTSDTNGDELVSAYGHMVNASTGDRNSIPFGTSDTNFCTTKISGGNLVVMAGSGYAGRNCTATFEYTKTTDTATIAIPTAAAMMAAYDEGVQNA